MRIPFEDAGLVSLPYPNYFKLPPFLDNPYTNTWTFPTDETTPPDSGTTPPDSGTTPPDSGTGTGYITRGGEEEFEGGVPPGILGSEALLSQFNLATEDRQKRLEDPNKITSFFNNLTGGGQRTVDQMMRDATAYYMSQNAPTETIAGVPPVDYPGDTRKTSGLPFGIGATIGKMLPNSYYKMTPAEQIFIQSQKGYTGDTVFGRNLGNQDIWGTNIISGWGNYPEKIAEDVRKLDTHIKNSQQDYIEQWGSLDELNKYGKTWAQMNQMNLTKLKHRTLQLNNLNKIKKEIGDPDYGIGDPDYRMPDTEYNTYMNDQKMLTPEQLDKGYIRSGGANIDAGHWVDRGHTLEDIKEDVTGMYTDDPSGLSGIDDAPSDNETSSGSEPSNDGYGIWVAQGGRVGLNLGGLAPRGSYFNGGLASLWRR
jgi:hypothetical protein